ncbi:DUF4190 domain-containing protein [Brachybacterium paraconglomeratum]|uniref:DUF4190 domain-containing protein n=1 Tax=Brachybacterium paraconglomeratum TaxID=173362 RepID=UPI003FCFBAF8
MSTQWGQDPYGPSSERYGPYGSSASADPYGSAEQHEAADPYGTADPYGAADPHGAPQRGAGVPDPYASLPSGLSQGRYAAPGYAVAVQPAPPSSGLGIAGFVIGLLGLTLCGTLVSPVGLVLSILGMRETSPTATSPKGGRGLTITGLILSIIGTVALLLIIAYFVVMFVIAGVAAGSGY